MLTYRLAGLLVKQYILATMVGPSRRWVGYQRSASIGPGNFAIPPSSSDEWSPLVVGFGSPTSCSRSFEAQPIDPFLSTSTILHPKISLIRQEWAIDPQPPLSVTHRGIEEYSRIGLQMVEDIWPFHPAPSCYGVYTKARFVLHGGTLCADISSGSWVPCCLFYH